MHPLACADLVYPFAHPVVPNGRLGGNLSIAFKTEVNFLPAIGKRAQHPITYHAGFGNARFEFEAAVTAGKAAMAVNGKAAELPVLVEFGAGPVDDFVRPGHPGAATQPLLIDLTPALIPDTLMQIRRLLFTAGKETEHLLPQNMLLI